MQNIKVAVDAVVFGYFENKELHILLIKRNIEPFLDSWALPGGLVKNEETLEEAISRELHEETGVKTTFIEQLYTFGELDRDPRNRVISVAYLGLVNPKSYDLKASTDASDAQWFSINNLPNLAFDHLTIVTKALERLRTKIQYQPIGFNLLKTEFAFSDLESLYQSILGRDVDRRNFRKKIMSYNLLIETKNLRKEGSGRPAKLFQFNQEKYQSLEQQGFYFEV
ncbi:8-oxo-dGTP diphosphatase [Soonwooa buanensis]|uniref:8-oxo-dGTP diphosphatase n=1 Tax=Soonwooa buanensis TaxID=619805 RepID=A0A1T5G2R9_9FLAO|nr:NUDIX domain-containing protein [Soonwooa buanensis]SKC02728.1 8-oxo-dGTP diphosphatase [Soonwooa buanensis]